MHVHVYGHSGEAKLWIEPQIELAYSYGLPEAEVKLVIRLVEEHEDEITTAWRQHFDS